MPGWTGPDGPMSCPGCGGWAAGGYGAVGGDWGSVISRELGRARPGPVIEVHLTVLPGSAADTQPDERELAALSAAGRERTWASWRRSQRWDRDWQGMRRSSPPPEPVLVSNVVSFTPVRGRSPTAAPGVSAQVADDGSQR